MRGWGLKGLRVTEAAIPATGLPVPRGLGLGGAGRTMTGLMCHWDLHLYLREPPLLVDYYQNLNGYFLPVHTDPVVF